MHRTKFWLTPKNQAEDLTGSSFSDHMYVSSSSASSSSDDENNLSNDDTSKKLVLYDHVTNGDNTNQLAPDPLRRRPPRPLRSKPPSSAPKVLPVVGAFTVQCNSCYKWRLIPTKKKYEEIREHNLQHPFICVKAREWRPDISCDDPEDVSQDNNMIWAIDKPEIPQAPDGWQRLLRIRGEGSSQFGDIYYKAPSGKKLRSMPEVEKFFADHPEYVTNGVTSARFSFQMPKPLQENYVKKKRSHAKSVEPKQVSPLAWAGPEAGTNSKEGRHVSDPVRRPAKKQTTQSFIHKDTV
ncbi:methyl-CpG-binding domain-containing protein 2 [Medicago truncatula]|nr:methyl-CpG-binding domain-containing protein 2 [Medicago truncatula]